MNKKTAYRAYYYSNVDNITAAQLKSLAEVPDTDISTVQAWMDEKSIFGIVEGEADYPWRISTAPAAPYVFYYQGQLDLLQKPTLAIVGPREMSPYAQEVLEELFLHLQHVNIVTVSGMAPGVDTLCHELSLRYNIPTVAILGGGFHTFLRSEKRDLMKRIVDGGGLILSEYKHSFKPTHRSFPQRNRLIAAVADSIFLPEAKEKSGSLITADVGHKIGKPVFAPTQSIFVATSKGTNAYIAQGHITPIADIQQFVEQYYGTHKVQNTAVQKTEMIEEIVLSDEEKAVFSCMDNDKEISLSLLIEKTQYASHQILAYISMLETRNLISEISPNMYKKITNKKYT